MWFCRRMLWILLVEDVSKDEVLENGKKKNDYTSNQNETFDISRWQMGKDDLEADWTFWPQVGKRTAASNQVPDQDSWGMAERQSVQKRIGSCEDPCSLTYWMDTVHNKRRVIVFHVLLYVMTISISYLCSTLSSAKLTPASDICLFR